MIFQGILTSTAKKPNILVIFRGGGGGVVRSHCPPSGSGYVETTLVSGVDEPLSL